MRSQANWWRKTAYSNFGTRVFWACVFLKRICQSPERFLQLQLALSEVYRHAELLCGQTY